MNLKDFGLTTEQHEQTIESLFEVFPQLADDQNQEWLEILKRTHDFHYPANTMLASSGALCTGFMLILDGSVRVYQNVDDGREVTLYRIGAGDICLMSLNSLIHNRAFRGNAISETDISILAFDSKDFHLAMKVSDSFRNLILVNLVDTVCGMMHAHHGSIFESLETRLTALLSNLFEQSDSGSLNVTHQELALELGSSREVISRLLKKMEKNGFIILKRGKILSESNKNQLTEA